MRILQGDLQRPIKLRASLMESTSDRQHERLTDAEGYKVII